MAKALVSVLVLSIMAIAVSTPAPLAGIASQSAVFNRSVCVTLASAASREVTTDGAITISIYSPQVMRVTVDGTSVSCSSGGLSYTAPLPEDSLHFRIDFSGAKNVTVFDLGRSLEWW